MLISCKSDIKDDSFVLRIRIQDEPDCLNPIVSKSSLATQIEVMIMPPLFEFDPSNPQQFSPILIQSLTQAQKINDSITSYTYEIIPEAVWEDGTAVSAKDVYFTILAALNPHLKNQTWRGFFKNIVDVKLDSSSTKKFTIYIRKNYMLHQEMSGNYCIYPAHVYDKEGLMSDLKIPDLIMNDSTAWGSEIWTGLEKFARHFESDSVCKFIITGCGPYTLTQWETGKKIVLTKKKNWWGNGKMNKHPLLAAYPDRIEYIVIPDEGSAVLALKNKQVDLIGGLSTRQFLELKNLENFSTATPSLMQFNYIEINHRNELLARKEIRTALAHLLNLDLFIQSQMGGLASRITSPVLPGQAYHDSELKPIPFEPETAKQILKEAGWKDSNNDGILDQVINGKRKEIKLKILVSGKETGKNLAILLQEEAKKAGIQIDIETKEFAVFMKDMDAFNFDLATMASRQSPSLWDPYQAWHSSNTKPGGFNKSGYINPELDQTIDDIRKAESESERISSYKKFQRIVYEEQVQIFLFSPLEKIVYSGALELNPSNKRPGYIENLIRRKNNL